MNIRQYMQIEAYGTSEGVTKSWDTRGRGRKEETTGPRADASRLSDSYARMGFKGDAQKIAGAFRKGIDSRYLFQDASGKYTPEREALHAKIIEHFLKDASPVENPRFALVAGGAGSGKSGATKAAMVQMNGNVVNINPDDIRVALPEFPAITMGTDKNSLLNEEAGDIRDSLASVAMHHHLNLIWDATGNKSINEVMKTAEGLGYRTSISFVHRPVEEAMGVAQWRAENSKDPSGRRDLPPEVGAATHIKGRLGLPVLTAEPGREVTIYDGEDKPHGVGASAKIVYHRDADGNVDQFDQDRMEAIGRGKGTRTISGEFHHTAWQGEPRQSAPYSFEYTDPPIPMEVFKPKKRGMEGSRIMAAQDEVSKYMKIKKASSTSKYTDVPDASTERMKQAQRRMGPSVRRLLRKKV